MFIMNGDNGENNKRKRQRNWTVIAGSSHVTDPFIYFHYVYSVVVNLTYLSVVRLFCGMKQPAGRTAELRCREREIARCKNWVMEWKKLKNLLQIRSCFWFWNEFHVSPVVIEHPQICIFQHTDDPVLFRYACKICPEFLNMYIYLF